MNDKQNVVDTYKGMLFNCKNKWNSDAYNNMDETWKGYAKRNKQTL